MRNFFAGVVFLCCHVAYADGPVRMYTSPSPYVRPQVEMMPTNATAQGVAELMARSGQCRHFGGNRGYEGVGMSSTSAEAALNACCYSRSGMTVIDQGVAFRNGRWYACKRYR